MKTIVLIPVKNERWIIENTLKNITPHVDWVIVADQDSTDNTIEICHKFGNVKVINNPNSGHSNQVRWLLLDEARKFGENNLIICIDADEIISPKAIEEMKNAIASGKVIPGDVFKFKWIQLWKSVTTYRNDGVWKDSLKNIAFVDNKGINEYKKDFVINDHTTRVPNTKIGNEILISYPLLHFHFVAQKRNQMKQAWYRCSELIQGIRNAKRINNTYRVTLNPDKVITYTLPSRWYEGLELPEGLEGVTSKWHLEEMLGFFDKYGIVFFEELQIWHVPELHDEFIRRVAREPISKTYPAWLVFINEIRNKMRNKIKE
jgi:glycosyltransferase involved in cell wall biosynthesis